MFRLEIETSNAAFQDMGDADEIARILRELATKLEAGNYQRMAPNILRDVNGNNVGTFYLDEES